MLQCLQSFVAQMVAVDTEFARFCADVHQAAVHNPTDDRVRDCYGAFIQETNDQFRAFQAAEHDIQLWTGAGQPYPTTSQAMRVDVRYHRHLFVYPTSELPPAIP
jgi:hypothetical protein